MYRGEPTIRQFVVADLQEQRLEQAARDRLAVSATARTGVRERVADAYAWATAWRWPHEGGHWQLPHGHAH
jgi:hypothetical protein